MVRTQSLTGYHAEPRLVRALRLIWELTGPTFWLALALIAIALAGRSL